MVSLSNIHIVERGFFVNTKSDMFFTLDNIVFSVKSYVFIQLFLFSCAVNWSAIHRTDYRIDYQNTILKTFHVHRMRLMRYFWIVVIEVFLVSAYWILYISVIRRALYFKFKKKIVWYSYLRFAVIVFAIFTLIRRIRFFDYHDVFPRPNSWVTRFT